MYVSMHWMIGLLIIAANGQWSSLSFAEAMTGPGVQPCDAWHWKSELCTQVGAGPEVCVPQDSSPLWSCGDYDPHGFSFDADRDGDVDLRDFAVYQRGHCGGCPACPTCPTCPPSDEQIASWRSVLWLVGRLIDLLLQDMS